MARHGQVTAVLVVVLALGACSNGTPPVSATGASVTSTSSPGVGVTASNPPALVDPRAAERALQAYLDEWAKDGAVAASRKYLVADQRATSNDVTPRLTSGKVVSVDSVQQASGEVLLQVMLDLKFAGDTGAWSEGVNERFVRFTGRPSGIHELSFATGP